VKAGQTHTKYAQASTSALAQGITEILLYCIAMHNQLKPSTTKGRSKALKSVNAAVNRRDTRQNILNVTAVTAYVSSRRKNRAYKLVQDLNSFYGWKKIQWTPPRVKREHSTSFLPRLADIVLLINSVTNRRLATFLQLLKETAMRCGEAWRLSWDDIDFKSRLVSVRHPEKGSQSRTLRVSQRAVDMLNILSRDSSCIFHEAYDDEVKTMEGLDSFRRLFERHRKRIAAAHPESNVAKIHFHTLRTWRATMEYLKTHDLEAVMMLLGATNPVHARRYVRLAQALIQREDDYVTARASSPDEAEELVREGFDYVTEIQGVQIFRKQSWLVEEPLKQEQERR
jgi:integrase